MDNSIQDQDPTNAIAAKALRPADQVMRLERMGSFHQSRLSFMRVLLRRLKRENWQFERPVWRINERGVGVATYKMTGPERSYTLVAFAHDLPDEKRSDRVIADAWDATFTLHDGDVTDADIDRLSRNVPVQELGRISVSEFILSRANRSVRLFDYVVDCLAAGTQPESEQIDPIGYLMRTTAVYGSGKFGAADRDHWADRPEFKGSFQPELLAVWLIRSFTIDMVEHMARVKSPETAVKLDPVLRRRIGVGNSTGLGMAPFLINHPALIHSWVHARETALARVRGNETARSDDTFHFTSLVDRAAHNAAQWDVAHEYQAKRVAGLRADFALLKVYIEVTDLEAPFAWDRLYIWAERNLTIEGQEAVVSLMMEPHGEMIDELATEMAADEASHFRIDGTMSVSAFKALVDAQYGWTNAIDYSTKESQARVWYVSAEKLEPRLGERFQEPLADYEQPLAPGRDVQAAIVDVNQWTGEDKLGSFLMAHPEHRHIVRRVQLVGHLPYAEVRDNTIAATMLPIDLLRCKLSFFGATKFDPRSDRWVRITMYQGAPFPDELAWLDPDDLVYPSSPRLYV